MRLEDVAAQIRPRGGWEAADLGFIMVRTWWKPIYLSTAVIIFPIAVLAHYFFAHNLLIASLIVWWLKPLYDRIVLFTLSRALFGDIPAMRDILNFSRYFNSRLLLGLTFFRLDPGRSFNLPVWELEGLTGRNRSKRAQLLRNHAHGSGVGVTTVCLNMEMVLLIGMMMFSVVFDPILDQLENWDQIYDHYTRNHIGQSWFVTMAHLEYVLAVFIVEPFFVAAGFSQYINRRTYLEGWDIEIAFRRLSNRKSKTSRFPSSALLVVFAVLLSSMLPQQAANAAEPAAGNQIQVQTVRDKQDAKKLINKILEDKAFDTEVTIKTYDLKFGGGPRVNGIGGVSSLFEMLIWIVVIVAIAILFVFILSGLRGVGEGDGKETAKPPETLFGLDIRPESLPDNIVAEARRLWSLADKAGAIGLLYRGALASLVTRDELQIPQSATEGDCVQVVAQKVTRAKSDYFQDLVRNWQSVAYAHLVPEDGIFNGLCGGWSQHFEGAP